MKLLADIGGTKIRTGIWKENIIENRIWLTSQVTNLSDFLRSYLAEIQIKSAEIEEILLAVAAPIVSEKVKLTNSDLTVDIEDLKMIFPNAKIRVLNDLEALGWFIQNQLPNGTKTVVLGIGTGFGLSVVSREEETISIYPSEYGHRYPSFEIEEDDKIFAKGLEKNLEVELFLSGRGIAIQFVAKVVSKVETIKDTFSREGVTDTLLRTLLKDPDIFTKFVFDIGELSNHNFLLNTGLRDLKDDDLLIKRENVFHSLVSGMIVSGGIVGPLLQTLDFNQLEQIAQKVLNRFGLNLAQEIRNLILTFLPNEEIFVFGSVANRINWEHITVEIIKLENTQFKEIVSKPKITVITDENAILKGLVNFASRNE